MYDPRDPVEQPKIFNQYENYEQESLTSSPQNGSIALIDNFLTSQENKNKQIYGNREFTFKE